MNIPSYAGGTNLWGEVDKKKARKRSKKAKCNGKDDYDWAEQGIPRFVCACIRYGYTCQTCHMLIYD